MLSGEPLVHLLAATRGDATNELSQVPDLASRLREIDVAARARWPGVRAVTVEAFFAHVGRHLPEQDALGALGQMHLSDLYLALACAMHDPFAITELQRAVLPPLVPVVARIADGTAQVEDVMQILMTKLLTEDGADEPKILQYSGRGPLGGWLRVAAVRAALSLRRKRVDEPHTGEQMLERVAQGGADLEIVHLRARYAADFEAAFHDTIRALQPRDRNLLHLHFIDGLTTDQIGLTYGVHGATTARWIGKARQTLFEGTKALLSDRLNLSAAEFQSLMGLLLSQLDISIRHLLAAEEHRRAGSWE